MSRDASSTEPTNYISDSSDELKMDGPSDGTVLEEAAPQNGTILDEEEFSCETSIVVTVPPVVTSDISCLPLQSDKPMNCIFAESKGTIELGKRDVNLLHNSESNRVENQDNYLKTSQASGLEDILSGADIEKEKDIFDHNNDDVRLSVTFSQSFLGRTAADIVNGSHPDLLEALSDRDDTVNRSSSESLDESMRPHPSLFSPHSFTTSTPRNRLSSTPPCSGTHRTRVPYSSSNEGPLSVPTINNGSKSYDYLLKVNKILIKGKSKYLYPKP